MMCKAKSIIVLLAFVSLSMTSVNNYAAEKSSQQRTRGYADERYKPVQPYKGPVRSGAQVYKEYCATCHDRTTQGAPLPDDDVEWGYRINKGKKVLLQHVMDGYKELMPAKGGCRNCSEAEVLAAIDYILKTSGVDNSVKGN